MHQSFNSHPTKNEEGMGLELERDLELFLQKT
jgi:hypothetical protein